MEGGRNVHTARAHTHTCTNAAPNRLTPPVLDQVKAYVVRQLQKIHAGGVRVQDFIFATEARPASWRGCSGAGSGWVCDVGFGGGEERGKGTEPSLLTHTTTRISVYPTQVKFGHYAQGDDKAQVGSAIVAYATMKEDPRAAPRYKERVPYVVRVCMRACIGVCGGAGVLAPAFVYLFVWVGTIGRQPRRSPSPHLFRPSHRY